ncbi:MAG TPA: hypothetical protein VIM65_01225, partial [Cyclobacteriaceae bacterium]
MNKKLILFAILVRVVGIFTSNDLKGTVNRISEGEWRQQVNVILTVNPDELLIGEVAINYRSGKGYVSANEIKREGHHLNATALRPTYPVWIHIALQNLYHAVTQNEIEISSGDLYFKSYAFLQHTISLFLF